MEELISKIVKEIKEKYEPIKIILYGSYSYGTQTQDSDIDILVIKNTNERPIDRWIKLKKILRNVVKKIPISPLVYNPKEIEERLAIKDFFIKEILENGKVIYG